MSVQLDGSANNRDISTLNENWATGDFHLATFELDRSGVDGHFAAEDLGAAQELDGGCRDLHGAGPQRDHAIAKLNRAAFRRYLEAIRRADLSATMDDGPGAARELLLLARPARVRRPPQIEFRHGPPTNGRTTTALNEADSRLRPPGEAIGSERRSYSRLASLAQRLHLIRLCRQRRLSRSEHGLEPRNGVLGDLFAPFQNVQLQGIHGLQQRIAPPP